MKSVAQACLLTLAAALAIGCSSAQEPPGATLDLLARRPEGNAGAGVHPNLEQRLVRLEPGAVVRYRIEARVPGEVRLAARTQGRGALEVALFAIDRVSGANRPGGEWRIEFAEPGGDDRTFSVREAKELLELRLAWRTAAGEAELELHQLALRESAPVDRPSIVLIVIDTLSARHLSAYGYPLVTDPELVRFASESFLFERCYTNAPWTVPSFMALMTGLYAGAHALDLASPILWEQWYLSDNHWTLAESLRAAGYTTAGFVDTTWINEMLGVSQGFDLYDASAAEGPFAVQGNSEGGIRRTTALARGFLEGLGPQESCLLFVHALDVHGPYLAAPSAWPHSQEAEPYDLERTEPAGGSPSTR